MNLLTAAEQWSKRPADERYWTINDAWSDAKKYKDKSTEYPCLPLDQLRIIDDQGEVCIQGQTNKVLSHHAFNQLATRIKAPANYLRSLPAELAAQNLDYGMRSLDTANILMHGLTVRAMTSDRYSRIWNVDVFNQLKDFEHEGWVAPPARPIHGSTKVASKELNSSSQGLGIKEGDLIGPAGIYLSNHDMFCFMVDDQNPISDPSGQPLYRGFFIRNSEVGGISLSLTTFYFQSVCGNHIVWDVENIQNLKIRHIGRNGASALALCRNQLNDFKHKPSHKIEAKMVALSQEEIGSNMEEVVTNVFRQISITKKQAEQGYIIAQQNNFNPRSRWGMVEGLTRYSQTLSYADERNKIDREAGKLLCLN